ncbi:MAG: hypothetical protein NVV67_20655, partial [Pseudoxanthomonas sp.]|nr:hypothetical protein [Pseudoxanthomonas sp.]
GTGLAYHNQRRRNASGLTEAEVNALSGGTAETAPAATVAALCQLSQPTRAQAARIQPRQEQVARS